VENLEKKYAQREQESETLKLEVETLEKEVESYKQQLEQIQQGETTSSVVFWLCVDETMTEPRAVWKHGSHMKGRLFSV